MWNGKEIFAQKFGNWFYDLNQTFLFINWNILSVVTLCLSKFRGPSKELRRATYGPRTASLTCKCLVCHGTLLQLPGFHMWSAKVLSLTVGKNSHCVVGTPWLAELRNDFDILMSPPAAELPPQGRWDAGPTASLRDRANGWGELQQFVFYFLRAISLLFYFSILSLFVCSPCVSFCSFLLSYVIPL